METVYFGYRRINILDNPINESANESDSLGGFIEMLSTEEGIAAYNKALIGDSEKETDNDEETSEVTDTSTDISANQKTDADANAEAAKALANLSTTNPSLNYVYKQ